MKTDQFEKIVLSMGATEKLMPIKEFVVTDEQIIDWLSSAYNLEENDRDGRTLLVNAACYGRSKVVAHLLARGADLNASDKQLYTALHASVISGDYDTVLLLIKNGANIHAKNAHGATPLMVCRTNHLEVIELLLQHGADPHEKNNAGVCAYDAFAYFPNIIELFDHYAKTSPTEHSD